jgi:hypothetical protein
VGEINRGPEELIFPVCWTKNNFQLSKKISEQEVSEIMREVLELPEIKDAEIVDGKVRVETKDNVFADVMSTVVNIFRRVAGGCELSFVGFAYKD